MLTFKWQYTIPITQKWPESVFKTYVLHLIPRYRMAWNWLWQHCLHVEHCSRIKRWWNAKQCDVKKNHWFLKYDYISLLGYFFGLLSHETIYLNKNELMWKAILTAIWYINDSLNMWLRIASAKFPQFLPILFLLHVKQKTLTAAHLSRCISQVLI